MELLFFLVVVVIIKIFLTVGLNKFNCKTLKLIFQNIARKKKA